MRVCACVRDDDALRDDGMCDVVALNIDTFSYVVVHPWVGKIVFTCNVFKTIFVRPTDTLARRGREMTLVTRPRTRDDLGYLS